MTTRRNWQPLLLILRLLGSGGLLAFLVWRANPASIWATWRRANPRLLALAAAIQVMCVLISAFKWSVLLRANNARQPYRWLARIYFVGQFANNFLPTSVGGDAMRVLALGRRSGNYARASASVFMERLTGFLALSAIALGAMVVTTTDRFGLRLKTAPALAWTTTGFALAALAAATLAFASPWLLRRYHRLLPGLARQPLGRIAEALGEYADNPGTLVTVMLLSLLFHATWIGMHLVSGLALGIDAPPLIYALMVPLTDIIGLAPIFVNNVGARDLVFSVYLRQVGVPEASALALAFTAFSIRLAVSSIGGLVLLFGGAASGPAHASDAEVNATERGIASHPER
jgi:uncharacterized protein (TIRG00374 family)